MFQISPLLTTNPGPTPPFQTTRKASVESPAFRPTNSTLQLTNSPTHRPPTHPTSQTPKPKPKTPPPKRTDNNINTKTNKQKRSAERLAGHLLLRHGRAQLLQLRPQLAPAPLCGLTKSEQSGRHVLTLFCPFDVRLRR